jgi:hypothetical protein
MSATASIPVTISEEVKARVAELGYPAELERMIEHTLQTVPGLLRLNVALHPPYDTGDEPAVVLEAICGEAPALPDPTRSNWGEWKIRHFPPEVCSCFSLMIGYLGPGHAR